MGYFLMYVGHHRLKTCNNNVSEDYCYANRRNHSLSLKTRHNAQWTSILKTTMTTLHASTTTLFQLHMKIKYNLFSQLTLWHTLDLSRNILCLNFKNEVHTKNVAYLFHKIYTRYTRKVKSVQFLLLESWEDIEANTASTFKSSSDVLVSHLQGPTNTLQYTFPQVIARYNS